MGLVSKLDNQTNNYKAKIQIGEYISEDILKVRSLFFELATTTTTAMSRKRIENKIYSIIHDMNIALDILEKGGNLKRKIQLNVAGHTTLTKNVIYQIDKKEQLSLEVIDIRPKLIELKNMLIEANKILTIRTKFKKENNMKDFSETAKKIRRFYKTTPAFFNRMGENIRRLIYESDIELNNLKLEITKKKIKYMNTKMILILFVIGLVLALGYWISRIINKENIKLVKLNIELENKELAVKAILNGQENIVIVSDGLKMIDANYALIEFFNEYDNVNDFKKEHECVCDFFKENSQDDTYIIKKDYDGIIWLEYILKYPNIDFKVIMSKENKEHHFSLSANKKYMDKKNNFIIIVSLNDITSEINSQHNLEALNNNLEQIVENKVKELYDLNENLEQKITIETQKVRDKDKQMIQQSRFAAMGEMIGNIAHQWRQPLSAITTTASGMQLQIQLGVENKQDIDKSYSNIMHYVEFLTQTIEDFRGFFREDKQLVVFDVMDSLKRTISITSAIYKDNNISLVQDFSCTKRLLSFGMPSELSQAFLNILNNAKDAAINNKIEERFVHIKCTVEDEYNVVYIQDNAGGIPCDIIEKIFDPYFTTKHQSQGTGIGLYMSRDIVQKHMSGIISVKNQNIILDSQHYNGACFKIAIPIKY